MLEVLLDNRDGDVWDLSEVIPSLSWKTSRIGRAGSLDITLIKGALYQDKAFKCNSGDILKVRKDGHNMFYGYAFSVSSGKDEAVTIKAYDQLRYLLTNDTYVFANATATQIVKKIADDVGLETGVLTDTGYRIPTMVEDNQKLLDIICKALDRTLIATKKNFVFYDDFGKLSLRNIEDMTIDFAIGDGSLMYGYSYQRDIDQDTYNRIKIVQDNKSTGRRDVYIAQDSLNIAKWGRLQLYQVADENMNTAQINEMLNMLSEIKNRERKSIKINAIGDIRVRAGCFIPVVIDEFGINQYFLVNECTHNINGSTHEMTLELKVV